MQRFLRRHPELLLRTPEAKSGARAMSFNKVAVNAFFKLLVETVEKYYLIADKIYNMDETEITVNPKGMSKIITSKGIRQLGALSLGECGETVAAEI